MMPIESNMRNMLMALSSGIKDPKMAEMLGKLLDSCLKHHEKVISTEMGMSDDMSQISTGSSLGNTISQLKSGMKIKIFFYYSR
jgi:hypothetical protein